MGPGFAIDHPPGFTVLAAHREDGAAFEVHRGVGADVAADELMVLEPRGVGPVRTWEPSSRFVRAACVTEEC